jgi:hypothetical protein
MVRKIAIILILSGIFINVASIGFVKNYQHRQGFIGSMDKMEIVITEGERTGYGEDFYRLFSKYQLPEPEPEYEGRISISYRIVFLFTVGLIFVGTIMLIIFPRDAYPTDQKTYSKFPPMRKGIQNHWKMILKVIGVVLVMSATLGIVKEIWPQLFWLRILVGMTGVLAFYIIWTMKPQKQKDSEKNRR